MHRTVLHHSTAFREPWPMTTAYLDAWSVFDFLNKWVKYNRFLISITTWMYGFETNYTVNLHAGLWLITALCQNSLFPGGLKQGCLKSPSFLPTLPNRKFHRMSCLFWRTGESDDFRGAKILFQHGQMISPCWMTLLRYFDFFYLFIDWTIQVQYGFLASDCQKFIPD